MAREKKKEAALSLEEKLERALIPESEQPYPIPENWCWVTVNGIACRIKRGKAPKYAESSDIPVFAQKCNQKDGTISLEKAQFLNPILVEKISNDEYLQDQDIVINSTGTGTLGRVGFYRTQYGVPYAKVLPDSHITVVRVIPAVIPQYLFLNLKFRQDYLESQGVGSTNQKELRPESIGNLSIGLPPLAEQQRIVDRIERLFAQLDEAKEKAQAVVDSYESRKAAILHKAFTGELTAKWRAENNIGNDTWRHLTFGEIISSVKNGTTAKQNKEVNSYPVTRIETLQGGTLDLSRLGYIIDPNTISNDDYYIAGDIAFSHINSAAHVGKTALIESHFLPLVHGMNLLRIRLNELCIPRYLVWYSRSVDYKEEILKRINMAVNQVSINQKQLKSMPIDVPDIKEQLEIVRVLDNLFAKEQRAKETAEAVLDQIDLLKKSILARAFRGELGTNDPTEESAIELLKSAL